MLRADHSNLCGCVVQLAVIGSSSIALFGVNFDPHLTVHRHSQVFLLKYLLIQQRETPGTLYEYQGRYGNILLWRSCQGKLTIVTLDRPRRSHVSNRRDAKQMLVELQNIGFPMHKISAIAIALGG